MSRLIETVLAVALIVITFLVFSEPGPVWFFPLFLVFHLLRDAIKKITGIIPSLTAKYYITGAITGIFIEILAIISSDKLPPDQRALFHPEAIPDIILAVGFYTALTIGTYFILKKYDFSIKSFFILGGIFGIFAEQQGAVLLSGNILGWIYVFLSYASLLTLPYMLFKEDFDERKSSIIKYPAVYIVLGISYAVFLLYFVIMSPIVSS